MTRAIAFQREGRTITADIINIVAEPLDNADGRQVVFFCRDSAGKKYRVPKSEVIVYGRRKEAHKCQKKKSKKSALSAARA